MLHQRYRRMIEDERGQALFLGAISLLILAVIVASSVSIGNGVYQKIKLQDAADAEAYSIAVKYARAYNFFAYTNRAMVVHYCAMMTLMSYASHSFYLKNTIGRLCQVAQNIPIIGPVFAAIRTAIDIYQQVADNLAKVVVPLLSYVNVYLWVAQEAVLFATFMDTLNTGGQDSPLRKTDAKSKDGFETPENLSFASATAAASNMGLHYQNAKDFLSVIDDAVHSSQTSLGSDPFGTFHRGKFFGSQNRLNNPNFAKYRLLMGNIANGSRDAWTAGQSGGAFLVGRTWSWPGWAECLGPLGQYRARKGAETHIRSYDNFQNRKDQILAQETFTIDRKWICYAPSWVSGWKQVLSYGNAIAADGRGGPQRGGFHQEGGRISVFGLSVSLNMPSNGTDHHPFPGITPFLLADPSFFRPWENHFGYPCNLVAATKNMAGTQSQRPYELKFTFMRSSGTTQADVDADQAAVAFSGTGILDMGWSKVGGDSAAADFFRQRTGGMMALSVGRALYHRPGNWKEPPNFFNPLWEARLAPLSTHWKHDFLAALMPEYEALRTAFGDKAFNY